LAYHDKAVQVLGPDLVHVPEQMSVYVAVPHGQLAGLYVQSNYAPPGHPYPNKLFAEHVNLEKAVFYLGNFKTAAPFNCQNVTYYIEPSFLADPKYAAMRDQIRGRAIFLKDDGLGSDPGAPKAEGEALCRLAYSYSSGKAYDAAVQSFSEAITESPDRVAAYIGRGLCYENLGNTELAIEDYGRAVSLNPNDETAFFYRGRLYSAQGRYGEAAADFKRILAINPNFPNGHALLERAEKNAQ